MLATSSNSKALGLKPFVTFLLAATIFLNSGSAGFSSLFQLPLQTYHSNLSVPFQTTGSKKTELSAQDKEAAIKPTSNLKADASASMSPDLYLNLLQQEQAEGGQEYAITRNFSPSQAGQKLWHAANPANQFSLNFSLDGVRINDAWGIKLFSLSPDKTNIVPDPAGNRLEYRHDNGLSEWYVNGPLGLEQGFILNQALPQTTQDGWLNLPVNFEGASLQENGQDANWLQLVGANGEILGQYGKLYAADASGKVLESHLEQGSDGKEAVLRVKVAGASYPVTIDPFVLQTRLTVPDGAARDRLGFSVAMSGDGNTALLGATGVYSNQGAVYVFIRTNGAWTQQAKLTASDPISDSYLGWSVSLSSDGNTAMAGAPYNPINGTDSQGAVYVFTRSGSNWSQQAKLIAVDGLEDDNFGAEIALSGDGSTALIAAPPAEVDGTGYQGAVYPFTLSGSNWIQHPRITLPDGAENDEFGYSVALNNNGTVAVIGSVQPVLNSQNARGAAYIYTGSGGNYTQQIRLPTSADGFGDAVAINGAGNIALIGALDADPVGAAYIFTGSGSSWTQQTKLSPSDGAWGDNFGQAVALSADGKTALIGAKLKRINASQSGAAYIFTGAGSSWTQQPRLNPTNSDGTSTSFGYAVALNGDGKTALVSDGDKTINSNYAQGAAYPFAYQLITTTTGLASSANPSTVNHKVTFTATISPTVATGTVTFSVDSSPTFTAAVTGGQAVYTTTSLSLGSHTVSAAYSGDANYMPSTSQTITQVVSTCAPLMVTASTDDGAASTCGTLSYALAQPVSGSPPVTVTFDLTQGNIITFTGSLNPTVKAGVTIYGGNFGSSTRIIINGHGVSGDGLHLSGNNYLVNLTIENFGGKELVLDGKGNKMQGVVVLAT